MGRGRAAATVAKGKGAKMDGQIRLDDMLTPPRRSARNKQSIASRNEKLEISVKKDCHVLEIDVCSEERVNLSKPGRAKKTGSADLVKKSTKVDKNIRISAEEQGELLKMFDLNPTYGPCRGISRRERYLRAIHFELKPCPDPMILKVLDVHDKDFTFQDCIWDQNELLKQHA